MRFAIRLAAVTVLLMPRLLGAASEARFTLGLTGEALSTEQTSEGATSKQQSIGGTVSLALDAALVDRRFFSLEGLVQYSTFDETDQSGEKSRLRLDRWSYSGSFRAFSNRMFTFGGRLLHATATPTGDVRGAIIGGVQDNKGGTVAFHAAGLPEFSYSYDDERFTADDPLTLRDERSRRHRLTGLAVFGEVRAAVELRKEDRDFLGGLVSQALGYGVLNLDVNRGGTNSWETVVNGNQVRAAFAGGELSDPTTVLYASNRFRHRFAGASYVDVVYIRQQSDQPTGRVSADLGSAGLVYELSKSVLLDAQLAYLSESGRPGVEGRLQQPSFSVGARWAKERGGWHLLAYPRVALTATSAPERDTESSLGGQLFISAQRAFRSGSSFLFDMDALYNQLTIAPVGPAATPVDASFLSGLERSHYRGRVTWNQPVWRSVRLDLRGEGNRQVRFVAGRDVAETELRGDASVQVWTISIGGTASRFRQTETELPYETRQLSGRLTWAPLRGLELDGLVTSEDRRLGGTTERYDYTEGGLRFLFGRLSLFARARQSDISGTGTSDRRDRRIWAGIGRTFDFSFLSGDGSPGRNPRRRR